MPSIENQLYGGDYVQCSNCSVKRLPKDLEAGRCKTAAKCEEWKKDLARATPADIQEAARRLAESVVLTPNELLAQVHGSTAGAVTTVDFPKTSKP